MTFRLNLILIAFFTMTQVSGQSLVINEYLADNVDNIADEDDDFSDWIELYNKSDISINLSNYSLSDDINILDKWIFPDIVLKADTHILVFASGKNRSNLSELHTNFKIDSDGEALYLSKDGSIVDQCSSVMLNAGQSIYRYPDGGETWLLTSLSTPASSNNQSNSLLFSHQQGLYDGEFDLQVESINENHVIYYTLNGNLPTPESTAVNGPIQIANQSSNDNIFSEIKTSPGQDLISFHAWQSPGKKINKLTVIRCASYFNGQRTSPIYTQTFVVDLEMVNHYNLPILSLVTEGDNFFDSEIGIYVPGAQYDDDNPEWTGNYHQKSFEWERDVNVTYFERDGTVGFSQNAGARIHGGKTRQAAQKSLRLYARSEYGDKDFSYPLFSDREAVNYKRFVLKTTMGAWYERNTISNDLIAREIANGLNLESPRANPVIVYLNGEYWGIHSLQEHIDERFLSSLSGEEADNIEITEWQNPDFYNIVNFVEASDLSIESNYEKVANQIDIENYIDYLISELFFGNYDWPANNTKAWRVLPDGKWRWILFDLDAGFREAQFNMIGHATLDDSSVIDWPNPPFSTELFRGLLDNPDFVKQFLNRYAEVLNTDFSIEIMLGKLDSLQDLYRPELQDHIDRWHFPNNVQAWETAEREFLRNYLIDRPCHVRRNLIGYFDLDEFGYDCDPLSLTDAPQILISPNPNDGSFTVWNNTRTKDNVTFNIYSMSGQLVHSVESETFAYKAPLQIVMPAVPKGTYVLSVEAKDYFEQKRLVIIE